MIVATYNWFGHDLSWPWLHFESWGCNAPATKRWALGWTMGKPWCRRMQIQVYYARNVVTWTMRDRNFYSEPHRDFQLWTGTATLQLLSDGTVVGINSFAADEHYRFAINGAKFAIERYLLPSFFMRIRRNCLVRFIVCLFFRTILNILLLR